MNIVPKIICRTVGTAGMGLALYDAVSLSKQYSRNGAEHEQSKYLEDAYFSSRTLDNASHSSNAIRQKTFELRSRNPLPALWGKIKGGTNGFLSSLGDSLPLVICASAALLGKNKVAKFGAIGAALVTGYNVARNGFGLGKQTPMD